MPTRVALRQPTRNCRRCNRKEIKVRLGNWPIIEAGTQSCKGMWFLAGGAYFFCCGGGEIVVAGL